MRAQRYIIEPARTEATLFTVRLEYSHGSYSTVLCRTFERAQELVEQFYKQDLADEIGTTEDELDKLNVVELNAELRRRSQQ